MNGWFPRLNSKNDIISGNNGIWVTEWNKPPYQWDVVGTTPCWQGTIPIYNHNDGTTDWGGTIIHKGYNAYEGSSSSLWAGFLSNGTIELYENASIDKIVEGCIPRFDGDIFGYLTPYNNSLRHLIYNGVEKRVGIITNFVLGDGFVVWREYLNNLSNILAFAQPSFTVHESEDPQKVFRAPDGTAWILTNTSLAGGVSFVRPAASKFGYAITGELFYPDAKMINGKLYVVGSSGSGILREQWIDFSAARQDLTLYGQTPTPEPPIPPIKPPIPPVPPKPDFPRRTRFGN